MDTMCSFLAFSHDSNNSQLEIDITQVKSHQLTNPYPGRIKNFEHRSVAYIQRFFYFDATQQLEYIIH